MPKKRILIDGRFIGVGESMTRYILGFLKGILELDKINQYTLLIRPTGIKEVSRVFNFNNLDIDNSLPQRGSEPVEEKIENCKIENLQFKILDIAHYSIGEQTKLCNYLNKEKFDLVHFIQFNHPILYRGKYVVTIHDLTLFGHLHREKLHKKLAFNAVMKSAVKNSAKIITISETSKRDIIENYGVEPKKIAVTYLAVDEKYSDRIKNNELRIKQFKEKYGIAGDYILYTGMWKKHKNLIRLLKAFEKFQETRNNNQTNSNYQIPNIQLVLVGKIDKDESEVIDLVNQINNRIMNATTTDFVHPTSSFGLRGAGRKNTEPVNVRNEATSGINKPHNSSFIIHNSDQPKVIITTGYIEEEELPIAYAGALFYVIPSLSEGFGLPPLEAMACGTPVVSSNISAMPEILGEAVLYFDPYDIGDMADKMKQMAENNELRQHFAQKGVEQVGKYSWDNTAKTTLEVYKNLI